VKVSREARRNAPLSARAADLAPSKIITAFTSSLGSCMPDGGRMVAVSPGPLATGRLVTTTQKSQKRLGNAENWRDPYRARDRSTGVAGLLGGEQGARRFARASSEALDTPSVRERLEEIGVSVAAPERRSWNIWKSSS
jgi:hypothetical protein